MMDDQYFEIFIDEINEQIKALNHLLVDLEKDLGNTDIINELFRIVHTIKGNAATMGFDNTSTFAHSIEDVLDKIRNDKLNISKQIFTLLFQAVDSLEAMLNSLRTD